MLVRRLLEGSLAPLVIAFRPDVRLALGTRLGWLTGG
jgi:hypothetical protein